MKRSAFPRFSALHLLCLSALACMAPLASAQTEVIPLPLSGPAYELAQDAYKASARGDYKRAMANLREAMRLRPDAQELRRQLQAVREQQQNRNAMQSVVRDAGYAAANAAFRAYNDKRYDEAVRLSRAAVAKSPDNNAYWLLLGNALIDTHDLDGADSALAEGMAAVKDDAPLRKRRLEVRREAAAMQAALVFRAQESGDHAAELNAARKAVDYAPEQLSYRLMLVIALLRDERLDEADSAATDAHARDEWQAGPLLLRAYVRQRLGREDDAQADFAEAGKRARPDEQVAARLLQADAALATHRPQQALSVLDSIDTTHIRNTGDAQIAQVRQTRQAAQQALTSYRRASLPAPGAPMGARDFPVPALDCNATENVTDNGASRCRVVPGQLPRDAGYEAAMQAYQALDIKSYDDAAHHAAEAVARSPDNIDYRMLLLNTLIAAHRTDEAEQAASDALKLGLPDDGPLLAQRGALREQLGRKDAARADYEAALKQGGLPLQTEIDLLARTGRSAEARAAFDEGRKNGALASLDDLQLAYLASRAGDNATAQEAFTRADRDGKLPDSGLEDAAYSAVHNGDDAASVAWFKRGIDAAENGTVEKTPQQRFDTRRAVSTIDREGGFTVSLIRSGGGPSAGNGGRPGASGSDSTLQFGAEAYWRPFGYQDGRTVEVFGRVFQTLQDKSGGATGTQTAQGTVGARWKPFASQNIVVSFGRLIPLGAQSTSDWLAQLAYSDGIGTDLRVDRPSWWTTQWYAEAGRYFQHPQTYGMASLQAGRSFRLDGVDSRLVVFPHLTLNSDYNSLNDARAATGFGPGVSLRYWFREDAYHAPRSYVDVSLQYRVKVAGDERARGFFLTTTLSY